MAKFAQSLETYAQNKISELLQIETLDLELIQQAH